jgi:hypothetical protein
MSDAAADRAYDPSDPWLRQAQTFPELTPEQIDRIAAFGAVEDLPAGTILVRPATAPSISAWFSKVRSRSSTRAATTAPRY